MLLIQKHMNTQPCTGSVLLTIEAHTSEHDPRFIYFNQLDGKIIKKIALTLEGGIDGACWR